MVCPATSGWRYKNKEGVGGRGLMSTAASTRHADRCCSITGQHPTTRSATKIGVEFYYEVSRLRIALTCRGRRRPSPTLHWRRGRRLHAKKKEKSQRPLFHAVLMRRV
ncbi:hypothetical protein NDU88_003686 [Pleurodeles waltl]|uniref:Uncharacterized protein n=1 Tax=Pleurodeles waltl TaxID=8319 RepID=A0AAV7UEE3_PLEWA|nr:hypothetical protein NDU88_003686 [Pleurodeles waltl]